MTQQSTNYDDVKQYRLDPDREQELVNCAGECTFCWANKAGHPLGVTTAYVPVDGKIWMTATRERVRITVLISAQLAIRASDARALLTDP